MTTHDPFSTDPLARRREALETEFSEFPHIGVVLAVFDGCVTLCRAGAPAATFEDLLSMTGIAQPDQRLMASLGVLSASRHAIMSTRVTWRDPATDRQHPAGALAFDQAGLRVHPETGASITEDEFRADAYPWFAFEDAFRFQCREPAARAADPMVLS